MKYALDMRNGPEFYRSIDPEGKIVRGRVLWDQPVHVPGEEDRLTHV